MVKIKLSTIILYFNLVILGRKKIDGYIFKEIGNYPIVGYYHFKGYEIINPKSNKIVYRKIKDWGYIGGLYKPDMYTTKKEFFIKNIL